VITENFPRGTIDPSDDNTTQVWGGVEDVLVAPPQVVDLHSQKRWGTGHTTHPSKRLSWRCWRLASCVPDGHGNLSSATCLISTFGNYDGSTGRGTRVVSGQ